MKIGRNEPCPCGSGKKHKKCCLNKPPTEVALPDYDGFEIPTGFTEDPEPALSNFDCSPYSLSKLFEPDCDNMKRLKKSDPSAYKKLLKRWTPSKVRALSNDQIIEKLKKSGIDFSTEQFLRDCQEHRNAWDVSDVWIKEPGQKTSLDFEDFLGLAACILWERLYTEKPSFEMIDDLMQKGYSCNDQKSSDIWWEVWGHIRTVLGSEIQSIEKADSLFKGTQCIFNWHQDLETVLLNASSQNERYAHIGIRYYNEFAEQFPLDHKKPNDTMKAFLGEMYCLTGAQEKGETIIREIIASYPEETLGYVRLAEAMELRKKNGFPPAFEEQLKVLEEAWAYPVVDGEDYSLDWRIEEARDILGKQHQKS